MSTGISSAVAQAAMDSLRGLHKSFGDGVVAISVLSQEEGGPKRLTWRAIGGEPRLHLLKAADKNAKKDEETLRADGFSIGIAGKVDRDDARRVCIRLRRAIRRGLKGKTLRSYADA